MCDIRIFISIRYQYDNRVNIEISIRFSIIFNCVSGVTAWAADIYKYASNTIYTAKLLHRTNIKPRKLVDKLLKWLDCRGGSRGGGALGAEAPPFHF